LQLAERAIDGTLPLAIVEGAPQHLAVIHCNPPHRPPSVAPAWKLAAA